MGVGVGSSWNKCHTAKENANSTSSYAVIGENTRTSIAYKVDAGMDYLMGENFVLDLGAKFIKLGTFSSAKHRFWNGTGDPEAINPYKFRSRISPIFSIGLRYKF